MGVEHSVVLKMMWWILIKLVLLKLLVEIIRYNSVDKKVKESM